MSIKPNYADAYTGLGVSLKELKRKDEAAACFEAVVKLRPTCALSLGNLAGESSRLWSLSFRSDLPLALLSSD